MCFLQIFPKAWVRTQLASGPDPPSDPTRLQIDSASDPSDNLLMARAVSADPEELPHLLFEGISKIEDCGLTVAARFSNLTTNCEPAYIINVLCPCRGLST